MPRPNDDFYARRRAAGVPDDRPEPWREPKPLKHGVVRDGWGVPALRGWYTEGQIAVIEESGGTFEETEPLL